MAAAIPVDKQIKASEKLAEAIKRADMDESPESEEAFRIFSGHLRGFFSVGVKMSNERVVNSVSLSLLKDIERVNMQMWDLQAHAICQIIGTPECVEMMVDGVPVAARYVQIGMLSRALTLLYDQCNEYLMEREHPSAVYTQAQEIAAESDPALFAEIDEAGKRRDQADDFEAMLEAVKAGEED